MVERNEGVAMEDAFELFELHEKGETRHSILHIPKVLPDQYISNIADSSTDIFNILMADVSASMGFCWPEVVAGWKRYIHDKLTGTTRIYAFASSVNLIRPGTEIADADCFGGGTDLTSGLRVVREEVQSCKESKVRIFIITDGQHGSGEPLPETEIKLMMPPSGKTVSVYLLGIGLYFPVSYSIDMRSKMHNGNSNIPALFWAEEVCEIADQMASIGDQLSSELMKLNLNVEGNILPGLEKTSVVHLGEWLYFEQPPEEIPAMSVSVNNNSPKTISTTTKPIQVHYLIDYVFRQWNSILIQQHRKKSHVPRETFALMDSIFNYHLDILKEEAPEGSNVKSRLARKYLTSYEVKYRTLMNQSKTVIDIEQQFKNELELAENILKSTVTNRKYDSKNLMLKGHDQKTFEEDLADFKKLYAKIKPKILSLPAPTADQSCRVTITSTLSDLQDPDFLLMLEEAKYDLLKTFTMSGIPIYAPVRDASQINPWTLVIKHILVTPFTILSQQVLEQSAAADQANLGKDDRDVILQKDNAKTRFNAIIPLVPASAAEVLKPIVLTNIYAMMCTFCILKNPHIIDFNVHVAALGCAWIRTVREFPIANRPEFVSDRLSSIVVTANLYMDRISITRYVDALVNFPKQAIMTESTDMFDGRPLKCESLIKPMFFIYLRKDKFSMQQLTNLLELLLFEFVGRCLSNYKANDKEALPYTDFFCTQLTDKKERQLWLFKHCKTVVDVYQANQGNLLERFYTLDDLLPDLKKLVTQEVGSMTEKISKEITVATDMDRVQKLSHYGSSGDIKWQSFQTWAQEIGVPEEKIQEIFNSTKVMAFVYEALQERSSKGRLLKPLPTTDGVVENVTKMVLSENLRNIRPLIAKELEEFAIKQWRDAYMQAHEALVMPMTMQEIVEAAQVRGIEVTQESFNQVYRYNDCLGLVRNACQIPSCPHYLQPHNNFNQHLSIEREQDGFPHALHLVSQEFCDKGIKCVIKEVVSGKHTGTQNRKNPPLPKLDSVPLTEQLSSLIMHYAKNPSNSC